ncbi:MAG: DUF86 domain-containing protein [Leptospiraceae bacterium]|nr:DUF86 domain-containing protein [Leptospiraceae bacterium]
MNEKISDKLRLKHALLAIQEIETYISQKTYEAFFEDSMLKSACMHQLSIIGDAFANISDSIKKENPKIDWKGFIGLRIKIVHVYFGIDYKIVWSIIKEELPVLKYQLEKIYNGLLI